MQNGFAPIIAGMAARTIGANVTKVTHVRNGKAALTARVHVEAPGFNPAVFTFALNNKTNKFKLVKLNG